MSTPSRKLDHLLIARDRSVESLPLNWFSKISLLHEALPEEDLQEVDLEVDFLGHRISAPLIIEGITGGHSDAEEINRALATAAQEFNIPIGVGSQRAALEYPDLVSTFRVAREAASDVPLIANIGATHIRGERGIRNVQEVVSMIDADAVAIHLNALQEAVQPEGQPEYSGVLSALRDLASDVGVPIVVKETGTGISAQTARAIERTGVAAIDIGGAGGTHWAIIEGYRYPHDHPLAPSPFTFSNWGIPTAVSIVEVSSATRKLTIIGSGGIRSGMDAAKAIALGAHIAGSALPFLRAYYRGGLDAVKVLLRRFLAELSWAIFLTGSRSPGELRLRKPIIALGEPLEWLTQRVGREWQVYKPGSVSRRWLMGWG